MRQLRCGAGSLEAAVAEPLGNAQRQQEAAERQAHQRDDEGEPADVGAGTGGRKSAEDGLKQDCGQHSRAHHRRSPLNKLTSAVVG